MDKIDFDDQLHSKANKVDVSRSLRNAEILHSQIAHVMVMLREFINLLGIGPPEHERFETDKHWHSKRAYLNT